MRAGDHRRLLAAADAPAQAREVDTRDVSPLRAAVDALAALFGAGDSALRLVGAAPSRDGVVEVVIDAEPLRRGMLRHLANIVVISLVVALAVAALICFGLRRGVVATRA